MSRRALMLLIGLFCAAVPGYVRAAAEPPLPFFAKYHGPLSTEWKQLDSTVRIAWYQQKFGDLERLLSTRERTNAAGLSQSTVAFRIVEEIVNSHYNGKHPSQSKVWAMLARWHEAFPDSAYPKLVRAMMLLRYALMTPEEPEEAMFPAPGYKPRASALAEAAAVLGRVPQSDRGPSWATENLKVQIARNVPAEDLFVSVDSWGRVHPNDIEAQMVLIDHVIGDLFWHPENIEALIRSLADDGKGNVDVVRYTRLYLHTFETHYGPDLFRASSGKWPYMRAGLKELARKWPSAWLQNHRAACACLAGDYPDAKAAFAMLGEPPVKEIWRIPKFYEDCRAWVLSKGVE